MEWVLGSIATVLHGIVPEWLVLPSLTLTLPHVVYWAGLLLFPLLAMYLVRRARQMPRRSASAAIAWMFWFWGGFVGLHRFYLRSRQVGTIFILLFALLLLGERYSSDARNVRSAFDNELRITEFNVTKHQKDVDRESEGAEERLALALEERDAVQAKAQAAAQTEDEWQAFVGTVFYLIVVLLLFDAWRLPKLARESEARDAADSREIDILQRDVTPDERDSITNPFIRAIEKISDWSGSFVSYWIVLAVFVYYYEVIARYVFNSPTNWAHEAMFLMFGMQYLLSGACTLRDGKHVKVDVIYAQFSVRNRARLDIATSVAFFIFVVTLIVTGALFAMDAVEVMEVSFTEWAIQYWPVKFAIMIGGILILLQGIAGLMRNIIFLSRSRTG